MPEFGHSSVIVGRAVVDTWGAGPFVIHTRCPLERVYRFEDSDRFGPVLLRADDEVSAKQPGEQHAFWTPYQRWRDQGRRVAEDGITCVWE